ncbi:MAG: helix-turn-helix domain-containing protein [Cyanobacteria bacterium J06600_6]
MRLIRLKSDEKSQLEKIRKTDTRYRVRDRAHALLLSSQGKKIKDLALIFDVDRDTIASWFDRWESGRYEGLLDAPHPGRPPKLSPDEKKS